MKKEELFEAIGDIDDVFLEEARFAPKRRIRSLWTRLGVIAACFLLVISASMPFFARQNDVTMESIRDFEQSLENSKSFSEKKAAVTEISPEEIVGALGSATEYCLVPLTERELFALPTDIFMGEIIGERYYLVDFGQMNYYYKVSEIRVDTVYRGDINEGDIALVKTATSSAEMGVWSSASGTVSQMEKGVRGIFMLNDFTGDMVGDASFDGEGVITHYFMDGERFAFLETADGLVFCKTAYPVIKNAKTLQTIEAYVKMMSFRFEK